MVSSIGNMGTAMAMRTGSMQQQPPPPNDKDAFKVADTNGDGVVSDTELETVIAGISEITGTELNLEDTLNTYDTDQVSGLSGEEMFALLSDSGFAPPKGMPGEPEGPPPPPPPSTEQALTAYSENSGEDLLFQLLNLMETPEEDAEGTTSVDIVS